MQEREKSAEAAFRGLEGGTGDPKKLSSSCLHGPPTKACMETICPDATPVTISQSDEQGGKSLDLMGELLTLEYIGPSSRRARRRQPKEKPFGSFTLTPTLQAPLGAQGQAAT